MVIWIITWEWWHAYDSYFVCFIIFYWFVLKFWFHQWPTLISSIITTSVTFIKTHLILKFETLKSLCTIEVNAMDDAAHLYIYVQDGRQKVGDADWLVTFFVSPAPPLCTVKSESICVRSVRCISLKAASMFSTRACRMDETYGATHWAHTLSASSQTDAETQSTKKGEATLESPTF